ncbi:hypothetical protein CERSUDRAFT_43293 [Gelatoporia subvermispora B]|uniref:Uncharacterized protein n=1 Tax=Ceriporiopsis subvermispora (strain B) TaxID=914234 RepID=M2QYD6_CERS8|nr:hypothetical protein CERSUDRAFT_43293 [Gelatoporia subvermispora B]
MSAVAAAPPQKMNPLLAAYLRNLVAHPLRTKAITTSVLQFLQEVLASHLAHVPAQRVPKGAPLYAHALARARVDAKAVKMALYGAFVSAPLSHVLVGAVQRFFAGKTGPAAKIGQILASLFVVAPAQIAAYLACMAVINGARTAKDVVRTVKGGFVRVLRVTIMTQPVVIVFAQRFLAPELWVPFFNLVQFAVGTYTNVKLKKLRLQAEERAKKDKDAKEQ